MNLHALQRIILSYVLGLCHGKKMNKIEVSLQLAACMQDCSEFFDDTTEENKIGIIKNNMSEIHVFVDADAIFKDLTVRFFDDPDNVFNVREALELNDDLII